jgi:hypothetical protein
MRLSEVLSKDPIIEHIQVEGFMESKKLYFGKQRKISIGKVALNYFCHNCMDQRTFWSESCVFCLGIDEKTISIDMSLKCNCGANIQMWFLVESENEIYGLAPKVRILKKSQRLGANKSWNPNIYGDFSVLLDKADRAFSDGLGAGSMVYLRTIFENVTKNIAIKLNVPLLNGKGKRIPFKQILEDVNFVQQVIPREFSDKKYRLFSELSEVIHGNTSEDIALKKYIPSRRLILGILENVKNSDEISKALYDLEWSQNEN